MPELSSNRINFENKLLVCKAEPNNTLWARQSQNSDGKECVWVGDGGNKMGYGCTFVYSTKISRLCKYVGVRCQEVSMETKTARRGGLFNSC